MISKPSQVYMTPEKRLRLIAIFLILIAAFAAVFLYTFLHEAGHALVGSLLGGQLTAFNVDFLTMRAHISMNSGITPPQQALQSAAGVSLPLICLFIFFAFIPRPQNSINALLLWIGGFGFLNTQWAWIILPWLYLAGSAPAGDDVTRFLETSALAPWLVSVAALGILAGGLSLLVWRLGNPLKTIRELQQPQAWETPALQKALRASFTLIGLLILFTLGLNLSISMAPGTFPPRGAEKLVSLHLVGQPYAAEPIAEFEIAQAQNTSLYLKLENFQSDYLDLSLRGPDDFSETILHAEGYWSDRDQVQAQWPLAAGRYQIILSSENSRGKLSLYWQQP